MELTAKIKRIFVPTDLSHPAEAVCDLAARMAAYLKARIVLFHAISGMELLEEVGRAGGKTQDEVLNDLCDRLAVWFEGIVPVEVRVFVPVEIKVVVGEPASAIAPAAKRSGADLILMATHGRTGLAHLLMGSVTQAVLRSIPVPVFALRLGEKDRPLTAVRRIMWATDLSPVSEGAWRYAMTLADVFSAEVILLHAVQPERLPWLDDKTVPTPGSWLEQQVAPLDRELEQRQQAAEKRGLSARRKIVVGGAAEVIVAEAETEQADLIVMGTHGRTGLSHVLVGSVAEAVIRKAPCPVLAVHVKGQA